MSDLVETWEINARINLYLLNSIEEEWLNDVAASKGRTVGGQFAHIHNVRLMWLKEGAPDLLSGLVKIEKDSSPTKEEIASALEESAKRISQMITQTETQGGRVRGFKPHLTAFVGYLTSHESHHRGQIMLSLKQSGRKLSKSVGFGLWEWGTR